MSKATSSIKWVGVMLSHLFSVFFLLTWQGSGVPEATNVILQGIVSAQLRGDLAVHTRPFLFRPEGC